MIGGKKQEAPKTHLVLVCPGCGKTAHETRRRCSCGGDLVHAAGAYSSVRPPDCGPCNFETEGLSCDDCPETCAPCSGYGLPKPGRSGRGGKECRRRTASARCYCCRSQAEIAENLGKENIAAVIGGVLARRRGGGAPLEERNVFFEAADIIRGIIEKPVLARIRRYEEARRGVKTS
jgi:hypothetical protein